MSASIPTRLVGEAVSLIRFMRLFLVLAALVLPATLFAAAPPNSDDPQDRTSLAGQFLIAAPTMADPRFRQTVLVMLRHNRDGAIGIVINRPAGNMPLAELMAAIGEKDAGVTGTAPVFVGGPVEPKLGFVLHSPDYRRPGTVDIDGHVAMTATREIFHDIVAKTGPKKSLIAFGYAGWAAGQLERELDANAWFTAPIDPKLVFDEDRDRVWELAVARRTRDL
jgi:putative transcriptional regulator